MAPILKISGLRVGFFQSQGTAEAVRGLDLEMEQGTTLGLVGESGCGKSLTALSVVGLLPSGAQAVTGSIQLQGREMLGAAEAELEALRGKTVSIVFQEPFTSLNPVLTVGSQVAESFVLHRGFGKARAAKEAVRALAEVGIPDASTAASQYPHQFSGGMRQRVLIAMALSCGPSLLIADEPTTALDVTVQAQILDLLKVKKKELGLSLLLITHDLSVVAQMAEAVAVMYAGRIVETGPTASVLRAPKHPYTQALIRCLPRLGEGRRRLPSLEGSVPEISAIPAGCSFHPRCPKVFKRCHHDDPRLLPLDGVRVACHLYHQ